MNTQFISSNRIPTFERFIDKYFWTSAALYFLLIVMAAGLAGRDDLESEQIAIQQEAEMEAWEQGFKQGRQATELSSGFERYYALAHPGQTHSKEQP